MNMIEVEIRFRIEKGKDKDLEKIGARFISDSNEFDRYFKFEKDDERKIVLRLRYKNGKQILAFKGSSLLKEDTAWQEWENEIEDAETLKHLLLSNGFKEIVVIDKYRKKYCYENFEINFDNIKNLGYFIEVELKGTNPKELKNKIISFVREKMCIEEKDIIQKGYVKLMLKE